MTGASRSLDLVVRARRVVTADGEAARSVGVRDGVIVGVEPYEWAVDADLVIELADDEVLLPGLVDTHVHVNEPGRTEWEGFATATRAAAAGGITTIVDMPLNSIPPTVDVAALEVKRSAARDACFVDVGFWGGAVPGNAAELRGLHDAGVFGFKCFLSPSGVDEFPPLDADQLGVALREAGSLDALTVVHAEDAGVLDGAPPAHGRSYRDFLASRPRDAETVAIAAVVDLARDIGGQVHVLHLSSSDALPLVAAARRDGLRLSVETCPHYLTFAAEEIADGATAYKCCPPIRAADNRERLWQGLADGLVDLVVSDHSPSPPELKDLDAGDFGAAWGGISSLQLGLPAVWTGARQRGFGLVDVAGWMSTRPAQQVGLLRKGRIEPGYDADLCVFAPDQRWTVEPGLLQHRHAVTPYAGRPVEGVVRSTWLHGRRIDLDTRPRGRLLVRGGA
ncbi:MAG: allantoinase AllB [Nocardioidaceae bacterium]